MSTPKLPRTQLLYPHLVSPTLFHIPHSAMERSGGGQLRGWVKVVLVENEEDEEESQEL